jgi:hypothetical protein
MWLYGGMVLDLIERIREQKCKPLSLAFVMLAVSIMLDFPTTSSTDIGFARGGKGSGL